MAKKVKAEIEYPTPAEPPYVESEVKKAEEPVEVYQSQYLKHNMTFKYLADERIEFNNGYFRTNNPDIKRAIESTADFKRGFIKKVADGVITKSSVKLSKGTVSTQYAGNVERSLAEENKR